MGIREISRIEGDAGRDGDRREGMVDYWFDGERVDSWV